ncbi:Uncharacterized protein NEOC65_000998 [Neochlamydia sp. AcF65]|nr:Uncharacterized protein [Neochlamydia sp. AcF65]MBS4170566.1 Uncharacterized protein [Neochlamydia sp. AcF95]
MIDNPFIWLGILKMRAFKPGKKIDLLNIFCIILFVELSTPVGWKGLIKI